MVLKVLIGVLIVVAAFVVWRYTSVARGANASDEALLKRIDPLAQRIEAKESVGPAVLHQVAAAPELRPMLYLMLSHYQRADLFPSQFMTQQAQAESALVYWMIHPNELQEAPSQIELVKRIGRRVNVRDAWFYVFRYKMPEGHWSGAEWQLGVAGPFFNDDQPYQGVASGFSRAGDVEGKEKPVEVVDWYIDMVRRKTGAGGA